MPFFIAALLALFLSQSVGAPISEEDRLAPKLLLNTQRLRRLKRERERQTLRWSNFESRVKTAPESPERGFELALYSVITGDGARAKEAAVWAGTHPCEIRQVALISDWTASPIPAATEHCRPKSGSVLERLRDSLFLAIVSGREVSSSPDFLPAVTRQTFDSAESLYAAIEYLDAVRSAKRQDLREGAVKFFVDLPVLFLLSLPPEQLAVPAWKMHAAALALVALDPNLEGSQFLQSWAMEDSQIVQNGPGVGYEFLWADPYLPGVSYRNMEPALYIQEASRLIARASWDDNACRVEVAPGKVQSQNCPQDWQSKPMAFGHLTLIPMPERCIDLPTRPNNSVTILWKLKPQSKLVYAESGKQQSTNADLSGMWRVSVEFRGKVCTDKGR